MRAAAMPRPKPRLAPVTMAVVPVSSRLLMCFLLRVFGGAGRSGGAGPGQRRLGRREGGSVVATTTTSGAFTGTGTGRRGNSPAHSPREPMSFGRGEDLYR